MKTRVSRLFALLVTALGLMTLLAAAAAAGAPAQKTSTRLEGTITQYIEKSRITVRSEGKNWELMIDGTHTMIMGKPAIDKAATVWYKKERGTLWVTKIQMKK